MHSRPLSCLTKLGAKQAKLVPKFLPGCRVGVFHNEHTRSTPLDPKLTFWSVSNYLGASGTVWLLYKTRCKTGRTSAKIVPRSRIEIFRNERAGSTPFNTKLKFWSISYHLGAFGIVWWPYETRCKMGRTSAKVRATKSRRNFLLRSHLIQPIGP